MKYEDGKNNQLVKWLDQMEDVHMGLSKKTKTRAIVEFKSPSYDFNPLKGQSISTPLKFYQETLLRSKYEGGFFLFVVLGKSCMIKLVTK